MNYQQKKASQKQGEIIKQYHLRMEKEAKFYKRLSIIFAIAMVILAITH